MYKRYPSHANRRRCAVAAGPAFLAAVLLLIGCNKSSPNDAASTASPGQFETTGEEFLIGTLDEIESIAEYAQHRGSLTRSSLDLLSAGLPPRDRKQVVASTTTDTTFIYGEVTPDGYGAVVTERHTYPKGLLLITVRKSYGKPPARIVSQLKRYITEQDFMNDSTQQSNVTELYGLSSDTLVTHVTRNGIVETYTFRLPVITRVTNPVDGSLRVTTRYGAAGTVRSDVRDGDGNLIQFRESYGEASGALVTYTEFPDASWRNIRTIGRADGAVQRDITSGP